MTKTLLAVDGNSLVHRSYHALLRTDLRSASGQATWAVKGFWAQLLGAVERINPDAIVVGFDDHTHSVRKQAHPFYKATRSEKPAELGEQIATTIQTLRSAGIAVVVPPGLEADDVLASSARLARDNEWTAVLVTSDRDAFALIDPTTKVLRVVNGGIEQSPLLGIDGLMASVGVYPWQYRDFAAIRGDHSDNLPGIAGIGEKTAAKLLAAFGTVEAALSALDSDIIAACGRSATTKLRAEGAEDAYRRNVEIMTMRADVDINVALHAPGPGHLPLDAHALATALGELQLFGVMTTATRLLADAGPVPTPVPDPRTEAAIPAGVRSGPFSLSLFD